MLTRSRRRTVAALAGSVVLALPGLVPAVASTDDPGSRPQPRIINGHDAAASEAPSTVAVAARWRYEQVGLYGAQFCGGTLVAPAVVVTAAHCMVDDGQLVESSALVVAATTDLRSPTARVVGVRAVAVHPGYPVAADTGPNDVAVLALYEPLTGVPTTPVAGPAEAAELTQAGASVLTAGWGDMTFGQEYFPNWLQATRILIHPTNACASAQSYSFAGATWGGWGSLVKPSAMICAASTDGSGRLVAPFRGDSGGPLLAVDGGQQRLLGAVSFGKIERTPLPYAVIYTRLAAYSDWLTAHGVPVTSGGTQPGEPPEATPAPTPLPPSPSPSPSQPPAAPADTRAPVVKALPAAGRRGQQVRLRYRVDEDSRRSQETAIVKNRYGRTVWRGQTRMSTANPAVTYFGLYRIPRNATNGKWCIRSVDPSGNRSPWSCAPLTVATTNRR